jgi:hypothetical protein
MTLFRESIDASCFPGILATSGDGGFAYLAGLGVPGWGVSTGNIVGLLSLLVWAYLLAPTGALLALPLR